MKNHQYIRQLSVKELARLLVKEVEIDEGNYDYDDNWISSYWAYYQTPNGDLCGTEEYAVQCTIDWLNSEREIH